ncbi:MAG: trypsin-like peptidase domain-containing protein [Planctomycetes bacterium]|nr:trypsin-like peptidase domain-containing protein [Planctomycetota bacterium]
MRSARSTMRCLLLGSLCFGLGLGIGHHWRAEPAPLWTEPPPLRTATSMPSFAALVDRVGPGVVTVRVHLPEVGEYTVVPTPTNASPARPPRHRTGSGFLVHKDGLVVTSRHVVDDARRIVVMVPQRGTFDAHMVGEDLAADLALLRLEQAPPDLPALPIGDSDSVRAGDWIVAVGNPFGFAQTVTHGIVSFASRYLQHSDFGVSNDFLQSSAPVNPGSSGGPVFDLCGRVVGVTTQAPPGAQGISFAVPSRTLKWALAAMERQPDGRVRRGYLGIEFATSALGGGGPSTGSAGGRGAVILKVLDGQPAQRAGLRVGDVVLKVDGATVADAEVLRERIVHSDPGSTLALELWRDGRVQDPVHAVLGEVAPRRNGPAN